MKKQFFILFAFSIFIFSSCTDKPFFDEERTFDRNVWNRFTAETFDIHVNNVENYYNIDVTVAVDTTVYRYEQVPMMFILKGAGGEERQFYGTVLLKEKGRWRGETQDGLRMVNGRIRSYFSFNRKGDFRLEVSQSTSQYDLEGIHSLTVVITKAKVDYDL
ncbi:MAG: hypothetical protein IK058_02660 [Bacteroidales bacterium]|nr:hypothetical protein [Bacteroidales bacterium]